MKPSWYYCNTLRSNFYLMYGWKPDRARRYVKKQWGVDIEYENHIDGKCTEIWKDNVFEIQVVWTRKKDVAALAHECTHAAMHVLSNKGIKLDGDNHEVLCYLIEALIKTGKQ